MVYEATPYLYFSKEFNTHKVNVLAVWIYCRVMMRKLEKKKTRNVYSISSIWLVNGDGVFLMIVKPLTVWIGIFVLKATFSLVYHQFKCVLFSYTGVIKLLISVTIITLEGRFKST